MKPKWTILLTVVGVLIGATVTNGVLNHLDYVAKLEQKHEQHLAATHLIAEAMRDMDRRIKILEKRQWIADPTEGTRDVGKHPPNKK